MLTRKMDGDSMLFYEGNTLVLAVVETDLDGGILMALQGELRSEVAHHIQDELDAFTTVGVKVTVDFKNVTFVSASALNALLISQQLIDSLRQGQIVLRNIPDATYRRMDEIGLTELLMIED